MAWDWFKLLWGSSHQKRDTVTEAETSIWLTGFPECLSSDTTLDFCQAITIFITYHARSSTSQCYLLSNPKKICCLGFILTLRDLNLFCCFASLESSTLHDSALTNVIPNFSNMCILPLSVILGYGLFWLTNFQAFTKYFTLASVAQSVHALFWFGGKFAVVESLLSISAKKKKKDRDSRHAYTVLFISAWL